MENKKILGTRKASYNGIEFDSTLERNLFKMLDEAGLNPIHHPEAVVLMKGYRPEKVRSFCRYKLNGHPRESFQQDDRKIRDMTYTYDIGVNIRHYRIIFEAKGYPNDRYPLKKKLFLNILEHSGGRLGCTGSTTPPPEYLFFEPRSVRECKMCIDIIKQLP